MCHPTKKSTGLASRALEFRLPTRASRRLSSLQRRTRVCRGGTGRIVTDNTRLVSEESALAALANHGRYGCRIVGHDHWCSGQVGDREVIAALHRKVGEGRVKQAR